MRGDGSHDCCDGQTSCSVVAMSWESGKRDQEHPEQIWVLMGRCREMKVLLYFLLIGEERVALWAPRKAP